MSCPYTAHDHFLPQTRLIAPGCYGSLLWSRRTLARPNGVRGSKKSRDEPRNMESRGKFSTPFRRSATNMPFGRISSRRRAANMPFGLVSSRRRAANVPFGRIPSWRSATNRPFGRISSWRNATNLPFGRIPSRRSEPVVPFGRIPAFRSRKNGPWNKSRGSSLRRAFMGGMKRIGKWLGC
jgi:hypothetical protein